MRETLFIVYGGANNAFFDTNTTAEGVLQDLKAAVGALRAIGALPLLGLQDSPLAGKAFPLTLGDLKAERISSYRVCPPSVPTTPSRPSCRRTGRS